MFEDSDKSQEELVEFAKRWWVESYVIAVCLYGWAKPPDWTEAEPVIEAGCPPAGLFHTGNRQQWAGLMYGLMSKTAAERRAA